MILLMFGIDRICKRFEMKDFFGGGAQEGTYSSMAYLVVLMYYYTLLMVYSVCK